MDADETETESPTYQEAHKEVWQDLEHDINEFRAACLEALADMRFLLALRGLQFGSDTLHSAMALRKALEGSLDNYAELEADNRAHGFGSRTARLLEFKPTRRPVDPAPSELERRVMAARGIPVERKP